MDEKTTGGWGKKLAKRIRVDRTLGQTGQGIMTFYQLDQKISSWSVTLGKVLRNVVPQ